VGSGRFIAPGPFTGFIALELAAALLIPVLVAVFALIPPLNSVEEDGLVFVTVNFSAPPCFTVNWSPAREYFAFPSGVFAPAPFPVPLLVLVSGLFKEAACGVPGSAPVLVHVESLSPRGEGVVVPRSFSTIALNPRPFFFWIRGFPPLDGPTAAPGCFDELTPGLVDGDAEDEGADDETGGLVVALGSITDADDEEVT
jgi:hypothetical protein